MSEEVIKILDALAEKFGLAIDWTSANVLPYLQQLCDKYVTCNSSCRYSNTCIHSASKTEE